MRIRNRAIAGRFMLAAAMSVASIVAFGEGLGDFTHRAKITVSGYTGNYALITDVPVLVRLRLGQPSDFDPAAVGASGENIRFFGYDGSLLPHEIDEWNPGGESRVWVKVPAIAGTDTRFYLAWGAKRGVTLPAVDPTAVWSRYAAVWHCNETEGSVVHDSTVNALHVTDVNENTTPAVDPVHGRVRQCTVADNSAALNAGAIRLAGSASTLPSPIADAKYFIASGKMKVTGPATTGALVSKGWWGGDNASSTVWGWSMNAQNSHTLFTVYGAGKGNNTYLQRSVPNLSSDFVHIAAVFNGTTAYLFANGELVDSGTIIAASDESSQPLTLFRLLVGYGDEVRITTGVPANFAEYIKAEYRAQYTSDFLSFSADDGVAIQTVNFNDFSRRVVFCPALATTTGCDFPLLVRLSESEINGFSYADCEADGADIRFCSSNGVLLDHEIDEWNPGGVSRVWVKLPYLDGNRTQFAMVYGRRPGAVLPAVDPKAVWSRYVAVWHCNETEGDVVHDSTTNALHVADMNGVTQPAVDSVHGRVRLCADDNYTLTGGVIRLAGSASTLPRPIADEKYFIVSGKMKVTGSAAQASLATKGEWGFDDASSTLWGWTMNAQNSHTLFTVYGAGKGNNALLQKNVPNLSSDFVHIAAVFKGTTAYLFANGESMGSGTIIAASDASSAPLRLFRHLVGYGDEVRITTGVPSSFAEDIRTEYRAQSRGDFLVHGSVERLDERRIVKRRYRYHASVTVSGATAATLSDFPVLVRLSPERLGAFSYADCAADGSDIRFVDSSGLVMDHEIDCWNPEGESTFWVKTPVFYGPGTTFDIYWGRRGSSAVAAAVDSAAVWSNTFHAVWHMDRTTLGELRDASGHGHDAAIDDSKYSFQSADAVTPTVGDCAFLVSADKNSDFFTLSGAKSEALKLGSSFSISGMFKASSLLDAKYSAFWKRKQRWDTGNGFQFNIQWDKDGKTAYFTGSGNVAVNPTLPATLDSQWMHITMSWNGATPSVYVNGSPITVSGKFTAPADDYSQSFGFGGVHGYNDEIRVRKAPASAAWAKAEYESLSRSNFCVFGPVQCYTPRQGLMIIFR